MFDFLKRINGSPMTYQGQEVTYGPSLIHDEVLGMDAAEIWRTQPHLRTVVTFMARNIAQLGLHAFVRVDETDRQRTRTGKLAQTLARPNANTTTYELIFGLVADLALYDCAYLHFTRDPLAPGGYSLYRLPPSWVTAQGGDAFSFASYLVQVSGGVSRVKLDASSVVDFHGWNPADARYGSSPVGALKGILAEQMMAVSHRQLTWQRGGRISSVLTRPAGATWSPEARESFRADWKQKFTEGGTQSGGTPILEDGMTINRLDFNAHENQFVEAARLALATVAGVYHVNPTMLGDNTGASYSNVREFRKMLYGDSLGPIISQLEDRINTFLVPVLEPETSGLYCEFNIAEKLQGNFEEQAAALSSSVGAPYMLRAEARARLNLPAIPDADQLVVPLNVLVGGQASPRTLLPGKTGSTPRVKERAPLSYHEKYADVMRTFFAHQAAVVQTRLGLKADLPWWDAERWDRELTGSLFGLAQLVARQVSSATLDSIGFTPSDYDEGRTLAWLEEVSTRSATGINESTRAAVAAALDEDDASAAVGNVFAVASSSRASEIATSAITHLSGFAALEAARQTTGETATKTWIVTSARPRPSHAAMSGETVALSDNFSNGMAWPGDYVGGADEVAGCSCALDISIPS